ncbi:hypothetical protein [Diplocloster modestus]|uniref:Uncharacterized protein n=1 Tax=Diplocloster modestus TaxID=2850322 RepID=A0ABS6KC21_9FIRM|nr:hypothetical protein [Diplocloster modestus]MBU9728038.1 hypothetical protein [Diplocloster modestus]
MIEIDGKEYELKYNLRRVELIENTTEEPLMALLRKNKGYLSLQNLKVCFSFGLKEAGSDVFVPVKKGQEFAEKLIEDEGYDNVDMLVVEALQRDCPFFFPAV